MMEKMTKHFSSRIDSTILVPSIPPYGSESSPGSIYQRTSRHFLGDEALNQAVLDFVPDVVYSDSALHAASVKLFSLLTWKSIPFIIHLRGDWWREYYSWFASATWRKRLMSSQQYCYNWFSLITAKKATPICRWLERVVHCHVPFKATEVVYQGVDPSQFDGSYEDLGFEKPAVAIIQNHTIYAKVEGLLNFEDVIQRLPSVNFYIAEGEDFGQSYVSLVREVMERCPNVHFVRGISNPSAVRNMLGSADASCACFWLGLLPNNCPGSFVNVKACDCKSGWRGSGNYSRERNWMDREQRGNR